MNWSIKKIKNNHHLFHKHDEYYIYTHFDKICRLCKEVPPNHILFQTDLLKIHSALISDHIYIFVDIDKVYTEMPFQRFNSIEIDTNPFILPHNDIKSKSILKSKYPRIHSLLEFYRIKPEKIYFNKYPN